MTDKEKLKARVQELGDRAWDLPVIEARYRKLLETDITKKKLDRGEMRARREEILNRVQRHAEEYNLLFKNCAQGTALAVMEEFGLGSLEIIKALGPFPGVGGTGEICGGITGSLIAFGLYFGSDDATNFEAAGATIMTAQKFMSFFEDELGHMLCSDIIEKVILGRRINPGASQESMETFAQSKGFEKCGLPPGIGARLAAGFIIESMV